MFLLFSLSDFCKVDEAAKLEAPFLVTLGGFVRGLLSLYLKISLPLGSLHFLSSRNISRNIRPLHVCRLQRTGCKRCAWGKSQRVGVCNVAMWISFAKILDIMSKVLQHFQNYPPKRRRCFVRPSFGSSLEENPLETTLQCFGFLFAPAASGCLRLPPGAEKGRSRS